jgi:hypothetical protein
MSSFRIYDNIPKTIVTPQIKTVNIPFTTVTTGVDPQPFKTLFGTIPSNVSILGVTATLPTTPLVDPPTIQVYISNSNTTPLPETSLIESILEFQINENKTSSYINDGKNVNFKKQIYVYVTATQVENNDPIGIELAGNLAISYYQL